MNIPIAVIALIAIVLLITGGVAPNLVALRARRSPYDIGSLGCYGPALAKQLTVGPPFRPLDVGDALEHLDVVSSDRGRSVLAHTEGRRNPSGPPAARP